MVLIPFISLLCDLGFECWVLVVSGRNLNTQWWMQPCVLLQLTLLEFTGRQAAWWGIISEGGITSEGSTTGILAAVMISEQKFSMFSVDSGGSCLCFPLLVKEKVLSVHGCRGQRLYFFKLLLYCPGSYSWTVAPVVVEMSRKLTTKYKPVNSHSAINDCV